MDSKKKNKFEKFMPKPLLAVVVIYFAKCLLSSLK